MRARGSARIPLRVRVLFGVYFFKAFATVGYLTIVGKQVYDLTGRVLDLGLLGLIEFLPVALLAPVAGTITDRFDRRWVFGTALVAEVLASLLLFGYVSSEPSSVVPIFLIAGLVGIAEAFASPSGEALIVDLSPVTVVARVIAIKSVTFQLGMIAGPVAFGFLYVAGEPLPYLAAAAALLAGFCLVASSPASGVRRLITSGPSHAVHEALKGLRFIRRSPILFGAMGLDLFAVLLGGAVALLPAIAEDRLGVGAVGLGWLRASVGIGGGIVAVAMSIRPIQRNLGRILLTMVAVFGAGTVVLGFSRSYALAFVALLVLSGADAVSMFIRMTLVPLATPEEMRGRVLAVENVFIGASNELGAAESGLTAALMGLVGAIVFGGACTIVVVVLWWQWFPELRDLDTFDEVLPTTLE